MHNVNGKIDPPPWNWKWLVANEALIQQIEFRGSVMADGPPFGGERKI